MEVEDHTPTVTSKKKKKKEKKNNKQNEVEESAQQIENNDATEKVKKKKKKQDKESANEDSCQKLITVNGSSGSAKENQKREHVVPDNDDSIEDSFGEINETPSKQKKKKIAGVSEEHHMEEDLPIHKKSKKKKKKRAEVEENVCVNENGTSTIENANTFASCELLNKKKKKKKRTEVEENVCVNENGTSAIENKNTIDANSELLNKKKKRAKAKEESGVCDDENEISTTEDTDIIHANSEHLNKKKNKNKKVKAQDEDNTLCDRNETSTMEDTDIFDADSEVKKKIKKTKKKKAKAEKNEATAVNHNGNENPKIEDNKSDKSIIDLKQNDQELMTDPPNVINDSENKVKKKKGIKKDLKEEESEINVEVEPSESEKYECKKKKRKKSKNEEIGDEICDTQIKRKKKDRKEDSEIPQKSANHNDEGDTAKGLDNSIKMSFGTPVFENEERQQKFQRLLGGKTSSDKSKLLSRSSSDAVNHEMCKGKEAFKSKDNSEEKNSSTALSAGQWTGMMFENSERQNKFLRLLGGAKSNADKKKSLFSSNKSDTKKGLFGSLTVSGGLSAGHNAMNLQAAATLNQNLEEDYNRALSKRLGGLGSAGIGFVKDPAEGKKFHIDSKATKSTKFSDDDE